MYAASPMGPTGPTGAAPTGGADDATMEAEVAAAAGGTDVKGTVTGMAMMTGFAFETAAGTCYDLAVASNEAVTTQVLVTGAQSSIYPTESGNSAQGRLVTYTHCADDVGGVSVKLTAYQMVRPGQSSVYDQARFAIAGKARSETPDQRATRHARERARFEADGRARCDEMTPSAAYTCMQDLQADLEARDQRAGKR